MYEVVGVEEIHPDPLNPRERIEARALALDLSLSRFGHVLPVVVDEDGTICSGHQRYASLCNLGAEVVPVMRVPNSPDALHQGARLMLFNLASADISNRVEHDPAADAEAFEGVVRALQERPEIDLDDPSMWPCMSAEEREISALIDANPDITLGTESKADGSLALSRNPYYIRLPILVNAAGRVVAGRQRFAAAAISGRETWPVITVDDDPLLAEALNVISMGYAIEPLEDVMRASVWLTPSWRRKILGRGFTFYTDPKASTHEFDIAERRDDWVRTHGSYVAEIGAGGFGEAALLNANGIRSIAFEPFAIPMGEMYPEREFTRKMTRMFLDEVAKGKPFTSVFASAVLNQVPFEEDRFRVLSLLHGLCGPRTKAFVSCLGRHAAGWKTFEAGLPSAKPTPSDVRVGGGEPGTQVTSLALGRVMIQKWHSEEELRHLCGRLWDGIEVGRSSSSHFVTLRRPKPIKVANLRKAIEFEFDLPWSDGEGLGLVNEAKAAFSQRLGVKI